ncbi:OmpA family protein [Arthrospiribacter ruber]|uniref:OmpA-like domain-containing protein n=1 Tax=Arthrospiribacter ruber TaxID=2487934 RepID=A0A951MIQ7_9BACT|nr:OmpA family protein [Arthrospiribacter ruber]MBW3469941.1 hypothetical protein [Arthrospiribacter ruber]
MRRFILLMILTLILANDSFSQQKDFEWRLGFSMGYSNYYGDISPYQIRGLSNMDAIHHLLYFNPNYFERPSFKASLERQLSPTVGLMFSYGEYHFAMSDRYVQRDGRLMTENPNFFRSLNFYNHTRDMGLSLVFKADNDRLLSSKSLIAPYFTLGFGLINFEVFGDLLDDEGNRYDYSLPLPVNNFEYETDLQPLRTENEQGYSLGSLYANLGLGFRIRLGNRMELFAQSDFLRTFTDYLDDVSGNYRSSYDNDFQSYAANPSGMLLDPGNPQRGNLNSPVDWIIYHSVGLRFNFGASKTTFSAPRLSPFRSDFSGRPSAPILPPKIDEKEPEDIVAEEESKARTNNYYNIQIMDDRRLDSLEINTIRTRWEQQILKRENRILEGKLQRSTFSSLLGQFDQNNNLLLGDTLLDQEEKNDMLESSRQRLFDLRYSIDSISRRESELQAEIDSIKSLLRNYRFQSSQAPLFWDSLGVQTRQFEVPMEKGTVEEKEPLILMESGTEEISGTVPETTIENLRKEQVEKITSSQEDTESPTSSTSSVGQRSSLGYDDDERIRRLQEEVDYLRYQRDRLILAQREQERGNTVYTEREIIERYSERPESEPVNPGRESGRRFRWWPFGAGAAAVARSESQQRSDTEYRNPGSPLQNQDAIQSSLSQAEMQQLGMGLSSIFLGTALMRQSTSEEIPDPEPTSIEEVRAPISSVEKTPPMPTQVTVRDTIYIENQPVVRIVKSKEAIYFQVNQREPAEEEIRKLADLAEFTKDNPKATLTLTGFADNTGNVNYNLRLAEDRTKAVRDILQNEFGVESNQIVMESGGQVVRGTQRVPNEIDRRVEIRLTTAN